MPTPYGDLTTTEKWLTPTEENNFEVIEIYKIRKRVILTADTKEAAEAIAKDYFDTTDNSKYDTLISEYTIEATPVR